MATVHRGPRRVRWPVEVRSAPTRWREDLRPRERFEVRDSRAHCAPVSRVPTYRRRNSANQCSPRISSSARLSASASPRSSGGSGRPRRSGPRSSPAPARSASAPKGLEGLALVLVAGVCPPGNSPVTALTEAPRTRARLRARHKRPWSILSVRLAKSCSVTKSLRQNDPMPLSPSPLSPGSPG